MKKNKLESSFISFPNLPKKSPNIISLDSGDKAQSMTFQPHDILSANSVMQAIDLTSGGCGTSLQEVIEYIGRNDICSGGIHIPEVFYANSCSIGVPNTVDIDRCYVTIYPHINTHGGITVNNNSNIIMRGSVGSCKFDGVITVSTILLSKKVLDYDACGYVNHAGEIAVSTKADINGIYIPTLEVGTFIGSANSKVKPLRLGSGPREVSLDENNYYFGCGRSDRLTINLPVLYSSPDNVGNVKNIDLYLKIGTLPLTFIANHCGSYNCIWYRDGYDVQSGCQYEFNAHWNGRAWIISNYKI